MRVQALNAIIDHSDALIFSVDREYRYTSFNRQHALAMQTLYGAKISPGDSLLDAMSVAADRESLRSNLDRALAGESFVDTYFSGENFHSNHAPIHDADGNVIGAAVLAQNLNRPHQTGDPLPNTHPEPERYGQSQLSEIEQTNLALSECQAHLQTLIDNLPFEFCAMNQDLRYTMQNKISRQNYGEVVGKRIDDLNLPPEVVELWKTQDRKVLAGEILHDEYTRNCEDEERTYENIVAPVLVDGKAIGIVGVGMDITARKIQEKSLQYDRTELENRLAKIAEASPGVIISFELNSRGGIQITEAAPKLQDLTGLSAEQLSGGTGKLLSNMHPEDSAQHLASLRESQTALCPWRSEFRLNHPQKGEIWIEVNSVPHRQRDGSTIWYGFLQDVSERKEMDLELRASEQRLRLHREQSPLGFLEWDEDFRAIEWNAACERIFGYTREEALGRHAKELLLPENLHDLVDGIYRELMNQSGGRHSINENITKDGRTIICEWFNTTLSDQNGRAIGVASVCNDITEQRRLEKALHTKREQLTEMTMELSLAEERERLRIASVLHDHIGQLLLLGRIKLGSLAAEEVPASVRKIIDETSALLDQATQDAHSLTVQLNPPILAVAGLEAALEWLGNQMQNDYELQVEFHDDGIRKRLSDELASVIYQCARELLINVARHARTLSAGMQVRRVGDMYQLTVSDQGIGFDPATIGFSAERGWRFGLFNIQTKMERLGGTMAVASSPQQGTSVQLQLPLAR